MSDHMPFDIQIEIIKKVSDVKSLVRFMSVSKAWKSFIESSQFINGYSARKPHSRILGLSQGIELRYICFGYDDNNETFKVQRREFAPFVMSPLLKHHCSEVVGACHGLACMHGFHKVYNKWMLVIWNPSIGKSFGIVDPIFHSHTFNYGFGVCPVTKDPTVLKIIQTENKPWHVEVFTLSSHVWNVIPSSNLLHESIILHPKSQVVIDRFIYWGARQKAINGDGGFTTNRMVVSFDLITKDFKVVDLPDYLTNQLYGPAAVSNLRESLVVYGTIDVDRAKCCGVWVMEHDLSFRKLYTIPAHVYYILGFRKSGEPICVIPKEMGESSVDVYDPSSDQFKTLEIYGENTSFFMGSYKESLLLLDHSDSRICYYNN